LDGLFFCFCRSIFLINATFGCLYYLGDEAIGGLNGASYWEYFLFSVKTLATIGYGNKFPQTLYADVLVTIEAMVGLLGLGVFAAIAFARLSIPRSRIIFSNTAVIADFEGVPTLTIRVANVTCPLLPFQAVVPRGSTTPVAVVESVAHLPNTTCGTLVQNQFAVAQVVGRWITGCGAQCGQCGQCGRVSRRGLGIPAAHLRHLRKVDLLQTLGSKTLD